MGKVTALHMDTITEKSGHQMTGMAVSVCLTPAAPSPLPIRYPTMGTVAEGIIDPCMRTKIEGAKILTVGGCMKACHGNEPGTLKEVVSLNTGGPCFPWLGAPNVLIEFGMAGITGSMGQMNKSITVGAGVSASNAAGGGGGGSSAGGPGGGGPQGPGNGGGGGGGSSQGAGPPSPPAPPGADGQASAGHPIDVVSGAMYTNPVEDLELPGPLVLTLERSYSTAAVRRRCGIGWGWSHDLAWSARRRGDELELAAPGGRAQVLSCPAQDQVLLLPFGVRVAAVGEDLLVEDDDGLVRVLRRAAPGRARGRGAGWARSRRSRTASAARASTTSTSRADRSASTASAPTSSSRTRPRERRSRRAAPRGRSAGTAAPCARAAPRSSGTPVAASQRAPVRGRCRPGATSTTSATASSQRSAATASSSVTCTTPSAAASRRRTATARAPGSAGMARASSRSARRGGRRSSASSMTTASRRSSRRATARTGGWS